MCCSARSARPPRSPRPATASSSSPPTCRPVGRRRWGRSAPPGGSRSSTPSSSAPPGSPRAWRPTRPAGSTNLSASSSPACDGARDAMPSLKTEITEIVTGAAISGVGDLGEGLAARSVANVPDEVWDRLTAAHRAGEHRQEFAAAWANGAVFLGADQGLRGRPPALVEWKGPTQAPGDEVVPADLRVDHVWLI